MSFSRDSPGELVILPIDPGVEARRARARHDRRHRRADLQLREAAGDLKATLAVGSGMYLDRFRCRQRARAACSSTATATCSSGRSPRERPSRSNRAASCTRTPRSQIETVTHKLTAAGRQDPGSVQGAKSLASRGLAGLKAAKALRKEGLEWHPVGQRDADRIRGADRTGTHADAAHAARAGRHPVDVHGPRVGLMSDATHRPITVPYCRIALDRRRHDAAPTAAPPWTWPGARPRRAGRSCRPFPT